MRLATLAAALCSRSAPRSPHRRRPRRRHQAAPRRTAVHAEPRRPVDGPERRPLRRLLPVRLRRLDEERTRSRRTRRAGASTASSTEENQQFLWGLLEEAAEAAAEPQRRPQQKIGDYFAACMDEAGDREARARRRSQPMLDEIAALDEHERPRRLPRRSEHLAVSGSELALRLRLQPGLRRLDAGDRLRRAPAASGLPDRDYYTKTDAKSEEIRAKYVAHVAADAGARRASRGRRPPRDAQTVMAHRDRAREGVAHARRAARSRTSSSTR